MTKKSAYMAQPPTPAEARPLQNAMLNTTTLPMLQPKLAAFKVVEFEAATTSAKAQFLQLVPAPRLDVRVESWDIVERRSLRASA